jgi:formylglycine-generating enzyme required for sulfatase activity
MNNMLLKKNVMSKGNTSEMFVNIPNGGNLEYDYQFTKVLSQDRINYNEIYFNKSMPTDLTIFDYEGIKFNMISCPTGRMNIDVFFEGKNEPVWEIQEIKRPFMLGETEVTQELFEKVMGFNYSNFIAPKRPVDSVSWFDCALFCNKLSDLFGLDCYYNITNTVPNDSFLSRQGNRRFLVPLSIKEAIVKENEHSKGFRLPRVIEWRLAAMAGTNNKYAGADDDELLKRFAWFKDNSNRETHAVAQKLPNEWGFYDMTGNISEWCNDTLFQNNTSENAVRATQGGDWSCEMEYLQTVKKVYSQPANLGEIGFRIARTL